MVGKVWLECQWQKTQSLVLCWRAKAVNLLQTNPPWNAVISNPSIQPSYKFWRQCKIEQMLSSYRCLFTTNDWSHSQYIKSNIYHYVVSLHFCFLWSQLFTFHFQAEILITIRYNFEKNPHFWTQRNDPPYHIIVQIFSVTKRTKASKQIHGPLKLRLLFCVGMGWKSNHF